MTRNTHNRLTSVMKERVVLEQRAKPLKKDPGSRHRSSRSNMLPQKVWVTIWGGLVLSGWDRYMVGWYLHDWCCKHIRTRGWFSAVKVMKDICHAVRAAALEARDLPACPRGMPRRIFEALLQLARNDRTAGIVFSRLARAMPNGPPSVVKEAIEKHKKTVTTRTEPMDPWAVNALREFVKSNVDSDARPLTGLPRSRSGCLQMPASKGGIDAYLRKLGEGLLGRMSYKPDKLYAVVGAYAYGELGMFCLRLCERYLNESPEPTSAIADEAYRAGGVLMSRGLRNQGPDTVPNEDIGISSVDVSAFVALELKAVAIPAPGAKARVIGVPDALTFVEAEAVRCTRHLMPSTHWIPPASLRSTARTPPMRARGREYSSLDLSSATDGLFLDAIGAVVDGWRDAGAISDLERTLALRSLGVEPLCTWRYGERRMRGRRGSPMGTPLSFPVLSWVNAWALCAFDSGITHGDDGLGVSRTVAHQDSYEEYKQAIEAVGASTNDQKTFHSSQAWTMCEVFGGDLGRGRKHDLFFPPFIPSAELKAPVPAPDNCETVYLRRLERVMKTRFPWFSRDPRVRMPACVGGFGYTGRGLAVPVHIRKRLAQACHLGPDHLLAAGLAGLRPWRESGLYPRLMNLVPTDRAGFGRSVRSAEEAFPVETDGVQVPFTDLMILRMRSAESHYTFWQPLQVKARKTGERPERNKSKTVFKRGSVGALSKIAPLGRNTGIAALEKLSAKCRALNVTVSNITAEAIYRGRKIATPTYASV